MDRLRKHILTAHGSSGKNWLDDLTRLCDLLSNDWNLTHLEIYPNCSWNYVAKGIQGTKAVVLKLSYELETLQSEVAALQSFQPNVGVQVLAFEPKWHAVLLEAIHPGQDLLSLSHLDWAESLEICCQMAEKIRENQKKVSFPFQSIELQFEYLEKTWQIPEKFLQVAQILKRDLIPQVEEAYLIHGDLHRGNILSHNQGWRVIDPKGFRGTVYNEIWPFIHEPNLEIPWISHRLGLDELKLVQWCFLHSLLATTRCVQVGVDFQATLQLGKKLFKLLQ